MLVLAFDTATPLVTVALAEVTDGCRVISERGIEAANKHGELLAPLIDEVLRGAAAGRGDLVAIAVGLGPGPFTGLRVGIVTAAALSDALGIPMYGVGSLDVVAANHHGAGDYLVATDARRKQVYWARYSATGQLLDGPELDPPDVLAGRFRGSVPRVCGAGALLHPEAFDGFEIDERSPYPLARDVAQLAAGRVRGHAPSDPPDPLYLRRPDARPPGAPKQVTPA